MLTRILRDSFVTLLGLVIGAALPLVSFSQASATGNANIYAGYVNKCDDWSPPQSWNSSNPSVTYQGHYCWHFDESSPNQWFAALDEHTSSGSGDANQSTYWSQGGASWSNVVSVRFETLSGYCTGGKG